MFQAPPFYLILHSLFNESIQTTLELFKQHSSSLLTTQFAFLVNAFSKIFESEFVSLPSICSLGRWVRFVPDDVKTVKRMIGGGEALGAKVAMWVFLAKRNKIDGEIERWVSNKAETDGRVSLRYGMWL